MGKGHRFESLDGMRGLCAFIVVVYHAAYPLNIAQFPAHGWLSVDMFFVLSGFVIALTYESRLREGMKVGAFMAARAKRLIPVQVAGTLLCAACIAPVHWHEMPAWLFAIEVLATLFLLPVRWFPTPNLPPDAAADFAINPPLWSLLGEWLINGLYAITLNKWPGKLLGLVIALAAAHEVFRGLTTAGADAGVIGVHRTVIGFLLGVLIYRVYRAQGLKRIPRIRPVMVYAVWLSASFLPLLGKYPLLAPLPGTALCAILIVLLIRNERPMGKFWAYLGVLSYPLYASHFAIINLLKWLWPGNEPRSVLWVGPIVLAQTGLAAILAYAFNAATRAQRHDTLRGAACAEHGS